MTATTITMLQSEFVDRLSRAAKFAAKPALMITALEAVQMRVVGHYITFTATDRYKAATFRIEQPAEYDDGGKPVEPKPHPVEFDVNIPTSAVSQLVKMLPTTRRYAKALVTVSVERGVLTVTSTEGVSFRVPENGASFPKVASIWKGMTSASEDGGVASFDPKLMSDALAAMAEKRGSVTQWSSGKGGALALRSKIGVALVMPTRFDDGLESEAGLVDGWGEALGLDS